MFVPGKPFRPSLMFVGKAKAYARVEQLKCTSLVLGPGLSYKHWTRLERLVRDKHSSLLRKFVNYDRKEFYNIGPRWQHGSQKSFTTFI